MLPHLTRVSFWLAAMAAGASLFTPGAQGALLATIGMVALIGALVLRRFALKSRTAEPVADAEDTASIDESGLLEVAAVFVRDVMRAATLGEALRALREDIVHELGAREATVHEAAPGEALVVAQRFPLGEAMASGEVAGSAAAGFALPVRRGGAVVAMLAFDDTALDIDVQDLQRLLSLVQ
ncbi:MAG TPA: hypothetical protein VFZ93_15575, partial [Albitalea sp.]